MVTCGVDKSEKSNIVVGKTASIDRGWLPFYCMLGTAWTHVGKTASIDRGWLQHVDHGGLGGLSDE